MKLGGLFVVVVAVAGCSKEAAQGPSGPPRPAPGKERGDCIAPPAPHGSGSAEAEPVIGTCDPGLLCLSNLCVRPPPADCQAIADQLASYDLGNYAELEERAPVVASYKAACTRAMVSKEQGECIAKATDKYSAFQCAPLMFPDLQKASQGSGSGDCDGVVAAVRRSMMKSVSGVQDPNMQRMFDAALGALRASCEQDGWPAALKTCIVTAGDNIDAMNKCNGQMSPELQRKMTERMTTIMQQQAQQGPPPSSP